MKIIGTILAILILAGIVFGIGFGVFTMSEFLSIQWQSLSNDWKAILIVIASIIILCTLFASLFTRSVIKKYGLKGAGKVMAYNDFTQWYSTLKSHTTEAMKAETLKTTTNQMMLWGSNRVAKQAGLLYELLQKDDSDDDQVLKKAEHVYIEIRRDLGLRGTSANHAIV